jgi:predicted ATP-grasp superfamily ATP-dependent carboligase
MKALIPAHRIGLTIARSLAKSGIDFVCVGFKNSPYNLAFYSNTVKNKRLINRNPLTHPNAFAKELLKIVDAEDVDFIFPLGPHEDYVILNHLEEFAEISELAYDPLSRRITMDKERTLAIARNLRIPVPKTVPLSEFIESEVDLRYPLIVKPKVVYSYSRMRIPITLITEKREMQSLLQQNIDKESLLVQEYVPGNGYGFFALYNKKRNLVAYFMHRRIHESLGWGGVSTLARSYYNERLKFLGESLLKNLGVTGVAMVEFRRNIHSGEFILMEINGRYWGSLPLAIAAGVDFPALHCKYWNRKIKTPITSLQDVCSQWLLGGETMWLRSVIKNRNIKLPGYSPPSFLTAIRDVISSKRCNSSKKSYFILQRKDFGPALFCLKNSFSNYCPKVHLGPKGFRWILPGKLAASAKPNSPFQITWLTWRGIKAIISLTKDPLPMKWLHRKNWNELDYLHVPMEDHHPPSIEKVFKACRFIDEKIKQRKPVLVHCLGGYGRTGTVLACFMMTKKKMSPEVAINFLRKINPSFIEEQQEESVKEYYHFIN